MKHTLATSVLGLYVCACGGPSATPAIAKPAEPAVASVALSPVEQRALVFRAVYRAAGGIAELERDEHNVSIGPHELPYRLSPTHDELLAMPTPFLPRNDAMLMLAISSLARDAWKARIGGLEPRIENREIVVGPADGFTYRVVFIKEDTGEVNSIRLRRVR